MENHFGDRSKDNPNWTGRMDQSGLSDYFDNQNWTGRMDQLIHCENVEDAVRVSTEHSIRVFRRWSSWSEAGLFGCDSWLSQLRASRRMVNISCQPQ